MSGAASSLLSAQAVRSHCAQIMRLAERDAAPYFRWHPEQLPRAAAYVADTIRQRYPDLSVPYHSRWRHFEAGGIDRWQALANAVPMDAAERARVRIDLVIPSVLLDAGAGPDWHYDDAAGGMRLARSEGLGVASLALFAGGALSADAAQPLRTDAAALARFDAAALARAFQVAPDNPLVGLEGRAGLLRRLGEVMAGAPKLFGSPARLGNLYDSIAARADNNRIEAGAVLKLLLDALGPVWPGRLTVDGANLGDCWRHPGTDDGLVPFHKLTQWLTYSLLEPLEEAGLAVTGLDQLTGLPEYRNGGLLLDFGIITPRDPSFTSRLLSVDEPAVVEWRALTVMALDRLADAVRDELGVTAAQFPLARILEGGTWAAGRRIAAERRPGGAPPVRIDSDGTVF
ncbi:URC4/urg3 family protein|uniref:URC4/urg3 family protein n=1 Tax=Noviherbaspirillum sp. L7-7A TaxID=2850560 RepID=UPI001C2C3217|nr:URC4/urg3 family protein [Noviherbaspirillum sp. L7-7A]MBV0878617.1 URC4/urg3 family protein [Noviherbaspirillum sp. L7-7A]